jgi:hypothetical protein
MIHGSSLVISAFETYILDNYLGTIFRHWANIYTHLWDAPEHYGLFGSFSTG